ncbi:MAG: tetratricopeptide repeat protein [Saprospiraceae bacterium]|nr:tetratricopeptide repeat protein [Saprospiraceae bacterium]
MIYFLVLSFFPSNAQPTRGEIYQLPEGVSLQTLPLDTVLKKVNIALDNMTGTTDTLIKQDLWKLLARAKATKDPLYIAKVYQCLADWHYISLSSEKADSIYFYDQKALILLLQTNDKELISRAYRTVGMDLDELQQYAQAEIHYFKGLEIAESIGSQKNINSIYAALSVHYSNIKDYESALKYNQSAVAAYEKEENTHP